MPNLMTSPKQEAVHFEISFKTSLGEMACSLGKGMQGSGSSIPRARRVSLIW